MFQGNRRALVRSDAEREAAGTGNIQERVGLKVGSIKGAVLWV